MKKNNISSLMKTTLLGVTLASATFHFAAPALAVNACDRQNLAIQIRDNNRITLNTSHPSGVTDNAFARLNIIDTANGGMAQCSCYGTAPCRPTWLDPRLLNCMVQLAVTYTYGVTELAGADHSVDSYHYDGRAIDVYSINGVTVNSGNSDVAGFIQICVNMGSDPNVTFLENNNHIHAQWDDNLGNGDCTSPIGNQRPSDPITTPSGTQSGNVTINYTLQDAESDICSILVAYSPDGGSTWYTATAGSDGNGTATLTSSPSGTGHTFVWASGSDIVNTNNSNVKFRITPVDAGGGGTAGTTSAFTVNNSVALLTISDAGVRTNQFGFTITGTSNLVIVVEACTNLANHIWSAVGTNTLTGGSSYFSDPQWANYPARFYRLSMP